MGKLLSLVLLIYVIGICVRLAPVVSESWNTLPASELVSRTIDELPGAAAWPMRVYESFRHETPPAQAPAKDSGYSG